MNSAGGRQESLKPWDYPVALLAAVVIGLGSLFMFVMKALFALGVLVMIISIFEGRYDNLLYSTLLAIPTGTIVWLGHHYQDRF